MFNLLRVTLCHPLRALVVKKLNHEVARRKFTKGHEGKIKNYPSNVTESWKIFELRRFTLFV